MISYTPKKKKKKTEKKKTTGKSPVQEKASYMKKNKTTGKKTVKEPKSSKTVKKKTFTASRGGRGSDSITLKTGQKPDKSMSRNKRSTMRLSPPKKTESRITGLSLSRRK